MRTIGVISIAALLFFEVPLPAQEPKPHGDAGTRRLANREQRGKLQDAFQYVRGDSGKWQDEAQLIPAPPISQKPAKVSLDDWADQLLGGQVLLTSTDDNWLLLRTRQLDDNDRVWVERVERKGNQITIVVSEAKWQGRYSKNFTYYAVMGLNLGKLEPGKYQVQCLLMPLAFRQFEGSGQPKDNWPKDERPAETLPVELSVPFSVSPKHR